MQSCVASIHPAATSGAMVAVAFFLFVDAVVTANREVLASDRFTFAMAIPTVVSVLGFCVVNVTKPADFHDITTQAAKARGFLFVGWVMLLGASVGALAACASDFVGEGTRASVYPGVAIVVVSSIVPLAAVALWWSKGTVSASEEFEW